MKAYAVFDGGGVKGAAFAGCLKACHEREIQFLGYGGTSAGSIIAFLAAIGYTWNELYEIMINEIDFSSFLDDGGVTLDELKRIKISFNLKSPTMYYKVFRAYWKHRAVLSKIFKDYGLYKGNKLKDFLHRKAVLKFDSLRENPHFTFRDLKDLKCPPVKIIASDLRKKEPVIYSYEKTPSFSVLDAIRASVSYPIVFCPVPMSDNFLVDGGLSINLPIHIFEEEKSRYRFPVIAFDLIEEYFPNESYSFTSFVQDMFSTALESSEYLLHQTVRGVYHVPIFIPSHIKTLDFSMKKRDRVLLFKTGHSSTHSFFSEQVPQWGQATNPVETLQAQYVPTRWIEPILRSIAKDFEENSHAKEVRCSIMLPSGNNKKIVVYQYNMDGDPDIDLELNLNSGCSGSAWGEHRPVFADLESAKTEYSSIWKMTKAQQNKIPINRKSMLSIPIFDVSSTINRNITIDELPLIGILSLDSTTSLRETGWTESGNESRVITNAKKWADILARILT